MLDPRIYRAGLIPVLLALIVLAFSFRELPRGVTTTLAPDAFDGARAFGPRGLEGLARAYPRRPPGSDADAALARRVASSLRVRDRFGQPTFDVRVHEVTLRTTVGERSFLTVSGERAGLSPRRVVAVATRDARSAPGRAELSGTAGLIELGRVVAGRKLRKSLVLVSTTAGAAGVVEAVRRLDVPGAPVDAVIVIGDLAGAGVRKPVVVPWSDGGGVAPQRLRLTVEAAVREETGSPPGGTRASGQLLRAAVPLTLGAQGDLAAAGVPGVLVSASGERGPETGEPVGEAAMTAYGRAVLRSLTALDRETLTFGPPESGIVVSQRRVLPAWAVRLLVGALIFPVLIALVDGVARVRRRDGPVGPWVVWVLATALPFALAALFGRALTGTGGFDAAPAFPVPGGAVGLGAPAVLALVAVVFVLALGWLAARPVLLRAAGAAAGAAAPAAPAALMVVLVTTAIAVWVVNPFAAALFVPALHAWLFALAPEARLSRAAAVGALIIGALPVVLVVLSYTLAFGLGPLELPWTAFLIVTGGTLGVPAILAWSVAAGALLCAGAIVRHRGPAARGPDAEVTVRGPLSYAGPGSLGGTESALRR